MEPESLRGDPLSGKASSRSSRTQLSRERVNSTENTGIESGEG